MSETLVVASQNLGNPIPGFATFAVLELVGHRQIVGFLSEIEIAGAKFLKSEVFAEDGSLVEPRFHSTSSIYCITPISREKAWEYASRQFTHPAGFLPSVGDLEIDLEDVELGSYEN